MKDLGRFVWFDLMTTNTKDAIAFYTETIGWNTAPFEGNADYTVLLAGEQPVGGIMPINDEMQAMNVPPNWTGSIRVADVDATTARASELGASVLKPAWDIPEVGRLAVIADPQGAAFMVFQPGGEMPMPENSDQLGMVGWHELNTSDYESAWKFYSALFGWKATDSMDMGEEMGGTYFMFQREGAEGSMGGMSNVAKKMGFPNSWLFYINVDACSAAVERITAKGGKIMNGPMEVPGGGFIAQCMDPQGAAFAIYSSKK